MVGSRHANGIKHLPGDEDWKVVERDVDWDVAKTAIIVCDMWNDIYCKNAKQRIDVMMPKMNQVLTAARNITASW